MSLIGLLVSVAPTEEVINALLTHADAAINANAKNLSSFAIAVLSNVPPFPVSAPSVRSVRPRSMLISHGPRSGDVAITAQTAEKDPHLLKNGPRRDRARPLANRQ